MPKFVRGLLAGMFASSFTVSAWATVVPWTLTETALFSPSPNSPTKADAAVWSGSTLTLLYDSRLVNGNALWEFAQSLAGSEVQFPSSLSSVIPVDGVGISFDFSHTGVFDSAGVSFEYYIPSPLTGIGRNTSYQANILHGGAIPWRADSGGIGTDSPTLVISTTGDITHVEFLFSYEMLQYQDAMLGLTFSARGVNGIPGDFFGTTTFANVSWLVIDGSSSDVTRWHFGEADPSPPGTAPEPGTLALLSLALAGVAASRRRRHH